MILAEETFELDGREIVLRSAEPDEAGLMIDYLKTVTGETRFLMCEPDEVTLTEEEEKNFIRGHNDSEDALLILAFVGGEYAGNCSFEGMAGTRRTKHRAGIGIALYQRFTGFGLGRRMLEVLLRKLREQGFEQAELTVAGGNERARRLYESLGFRECGRIPRASRYDDGTYGDNILMVLPLE